MSTLDPRDTQDFWLFGYGSLIWKPPPHFDRRVPGYIKGYVRRFWQASEDHRGTPKAPGRVVTLIERSLWESLEDPRSTEGDRVWGVAYHIIPSRVKEVKEYLDIREINGYSIQYTPFHPADTSSVENLTCLVYIGMPDNPQFLGALQPEEVAKRISESVGPSGENREYLLQLEAALQELSIDSGDEHISDLARRVRAITPPIRAPGESSSPENVLRKINSTEEQEEIEKDARLDDGRSWS